MSDITDSAGAPVPSSEPDDTYVTDEAWLLHDIRDLLREVVRLLRFANEPAEHAQRHAQPRNTAGGPDSA